MSTAIPTTFSLADISPLFRSVNTNINAGIAPAYVGSFGLHTGVSGGESIVTGSTIDLMPRNLEFCTDTQQDLQETPQDERDDCDGPGINSVPVYAPVSGRVQIFTETRTAQDGTTPLRVITVEIDPDWQLSSQADHRNVTLTHIVPSVSNGQVVVSGELIGYLCSQSQSVSMCGIERFDSGDAPTHLAFQLRLNRAGQVRSDLLRAGFSENAVREEVIGFLANSLCIYDEWIFDLSGRTRRATPSVFSACN
jgi:hypothetical protein